MSINEPDILLDKVVTTITTLSPLIFNKADILIACNNSLSERDTLFNSHLNIN
ncbi:hypothetical protein PROSTU_02415 [Providencia stuartii ATCC 25827]|uniref:Uncharacterized protein n=1 Tax=Providencia stuartii ATCC 25827 TaxID=471874 RepID=A0AA86YJ29_PROST|nr:hypothetical protein PROSTU_02415 [Providencia stuartii ATCC 25827]